MRAAGRHLFVGAAGEAGDAAAQILVVAVGLRHAVAAPALIAHLVAQNRVFDVGEDFVVVIAFVVMRVDVDDAQILVMPLDRLLPGIGQDLVLVDLFGRRITVDRFARVHYISSIAERVPRHPRHIPVRILVDPPPRRHNVAAVA